MKTIGLVTQKGGAGKSTAAIALATALAQQHSVALVDLDPQGSVAKWAKLTVPPESLRILEGDKASDLKSLTDFDYVVVDTKGELSAQALPYLDLVLLPVQPSIFDIWATGETVELVKAHRAKRPALQAALFLSRLQPNTKLGKEADEALAGFGLSVLDVPLRQRIAYPAALADGKSPVRSGDGEIRLESLRFAAAVKKLLEA